MRLFHWLCVNDIPGGWDLRRCGWRLAVGAADPAEGVALASPAGMDRQAWSRLRHAWPRPGHKRVLLLGVCDSTERGRLLRLGFGDVLGETAVLREVEARAARIALHAGMVPSARLVGPLRLDLFARDGFVGPQRLALHPREFALLWRLSDAPGRAVGKRVLLSEVWRLGHVPETNSLAVHVSRLRAKLAAVGLADLVLTAPDGGYMLASSKESEDRAVPMLTVDSPLDDLIATEADDRRGDGGQ